jgi:orotidine-5'-phosphate decarboxylase
MLGGHMLVGHMLGGHMLGGHMLGGHMLGGHMLVGHMLGGHMLVGSDAMGVGETPMPDGMAPHRPGNPRGLPEDMAERLIVALDVPTIAAADKIVADLDGTVAFFKIGLWLAFAEGVDGLIKRLIGANKRVFLDAKMYDIGQTVEEGVKRAADRGVSFVTVHGDARIIQSAVKGKRDSGGDIKIFSITVLTSLSTDDLKAMGYACSAQDLIHLRVTEAIKYGCDGIIASAHDDPDNIRRVAGDSSLLIATPGVRSAGEPTHDHKRLATPADAIEKGADYLVVGRSIIAGSEAPRPAAQRIIREMMEGDERRRSGI